MKLKDMKIPAMTRLMQSYMKSKPITEKELNGLPMGKYFKVRFLDHPNYEHLRRRD